MHRAPTPAANKPPSQPPIQAAPKLRRAVVSLGSYGSAIHHNGQELALQIRPRAELEGPQQAALPQLNGPQEQELIGNAFLRFPQLTELATDKRVQRQLAQDLRIQLDAQLKAERSPWKILELQLHPSLGPIPAEN